MIEEIKQNIPNRFANMDPFHFEEFVCEVFKDSGYQAIVTKATGDFGADIILTKNNTKIAVQVKRYDRTNLVGVKEINQIIGGREYYKCSKAIIVITSDFTKAAKKLAEQTNIELWNWDKLYNEIKKIYLEGKDVYDFFKNKESFNNKNQMMSKKPKFLFKIEKIEEDVSLTDKNIATVVHIQMINMTNEKIYVTIETPIIITVLGNQIDAYTGYVGSFTQGYIYPQLSVPIIFCWYGDQIPKSHLVKSVVMKYYEENKETKEELVYPDLVTKIINETETVSVNKQTNKPNSGCFIATAVYGTSLAPEINILRNFRDRFLLKNQLGKVFVNFYYQNSPPVANFISRHILLRKMLRQIIIEPAVKTIKFFYENLR